MSRAGLASSCETLTFPASSSESTVVSEWGLVCDRAWLAPLTMSLFMGGVIAGSLALGALSDAAGRRRALILCAAARVAATAFSAATSDFEVTHHSSPNKN